MKQQRDPWDMFLVGLFLGIIIGGLTVVAFMHP